MYNLSDLVIFLISLALGFLICKNQKLVWKALLSISIHGILALAYLTYLASGGGFDLQKLIAFIGLSYMLGGKQYVFMVTGKYLAFIAAYGTCHFIVPKIINKKPENLSYK